MSENAYQAGAAESLVAFTLPHRVPNEDQYLIESMASGAIQGDGPFTARASALLRPLVGGGLSLLTTSCTHALEMAALLLDIGPGDEVVVPSFTFPSTVNAVVLRGATPVFVDVRLDTMNLDERLIEGAITERTRAILVVHYGGVACEMDEISRIADRHGLVVVEDNAHGLGASYAGRPLGSLGALATQSFHATKNISCGEGGALIVNDERLLERAEVVREKGTNRSQFRRGQVDKYRWVDVGSSWLISDVLAALLTAQLESFDDVQRRRHEVWSTYEERLAGWAEDSGVLTPVVPPGRTHSAHLYSLLLPTEAERDRFIAHCSQRRIVTPFHYVPLHSSPAGLRFGRVHGSCQVSDDVSGRLVRLPLHAGLTDDEVERVVDSVLEFEVAR